jgi:hypothetical protein
LNIDALLRIASPRDLEDYCSRYPDAALVRNASSRDRDPGLDIDARPDGESTTAIPLEPPVAPIASGDRLSETPRPEADDRSQVIFLTKTVRNPFKNMITLGRAANNDVQIDHPTVSKAHVAFLREDDRWSVLDHGSTNGTVVNRVRLPKNSATPLADGASIQLGDEIVLRFYTPAGMFRLLERAALLDRIS